MTYSGWRRSVFTRPFGYLRTPELHGRTGIARPETALDGIGAALSWRRLLAASRLRLEQHSEFALSSAVSGREVLGCFDFLLSLGDFVIYKLNVQ